MTPPIPPRPKKQPEPAKTKFSPFGEDLFGHEISQQKKSVVSKRFLVPPFTVLNAREGDWQERKRAWVSLGIKSEVGRGAVTCNTGGCGTLSKKMKKEERILLAESSGTDFYIQKRAKEKELGRSISTQEFQEKYYEQSSAVDSGTSIFDPVLCELAYRWFARPGSQVVDPFAGGSVRGVVASCLGLNYWGGELRQEQVEANRKQADEICSESIPVWVCGDSMETIPTAPNSDLLFSCPPYGDLEVYSDDPSDLSNMKWPEFLESYREIIKRSCDGMKDNRLACFVVGDFRDSSGHYRNFVSETICAFLDSGLTLYNEAILVTSVGSASMRVTRQFDAGRKLCKTHQNVLVFCKGDWRKASEYLNAK